MSKNKKNKVLNQKAPFLFEAILALVLFMANLVLFNDHVEKGWVLGVSKKADEKVAPGQAKKLENGVTTKLEAKVHVQKINDVVTTLESVSSEEGDLGNDEVSDELSEAAEDLEDVAEDVAEKVEELENRPAWKKALLGPDYKNLGELRSSLVHTDNGIRKVTKNMTRVEGADSDEALQQQLGELNQERERVVSFIQEQEDSFSLFGWLMKIVSGYDSEVKDTADSSEVGGSTELVE